MTCFSKSASASADVAATASLDRHWGSVRGIVRYNWFANAVPVLGFGNPFRATDSTDASAYQIMPAGVVESPRRSSMASPSC